MEFFNLFEQLNVITPYLSKIMSLIIFSAILLIIMHYLIKYLEKFDDGSAMDRKPLKRLSSLIHTVTYFLIFLAVLDSFGMNLQSLIVSFGLVGVAVSLAAKDTLSNLISGLMIYIDKKFRVGDLIEIDGRLGTVVHINFKYVELYYKKQSIFVPNTLFSTKSYINHTSYDCYPQTFHLNISNKYNLEEKIAEIERILDDNPLILKEPSYLILPRDVTPYGVDVMIKIFIEDPQQNSIIRGKLIRQIKQDILLEDTA